VHLGLHIHAFTIVAPVNSRGIKLNGVELVVVSPRDPDILPGLNRSFDNLPV
jgi:hypothetical protein